MLNDAEMDEDFKNQQKEAFAAAGLIEDVEYNIDKDKFKF
jgi:hypothetical protein